MIFRRLKCLLTISLIICFTASSFAQQTTAPGDNPPVEKVGPRRQLATIIFAGLGGAVLGLSTLSFYGRPQDQLANIAIGFAIGVIVGTVYVTYQTAAKPKEYYTANPAEYYFANTQRKSLLSATNTSPPLLNLTLKF